MTSLPPELPSKGRHMRRELDLQVLPFKSILSLIKDRCAPFEFESYGEGKSYVYFLPEASIELDHAVCFGKRRAVNFYEQHYEGLGHKFVDEYGNTHIIVSRVLYIYSVSRGPTHAKVVSEGNDAMLDVLEKERAIQNKFETQFNKDENGYEIDPFLKYGPTEVVLFGHTHPDLGCFFSSTDHNSNYSTPTSPIATFVCDPIRKDMKAMVGIQCESAKVIVCRPVSFPAPTVNRSTIAPRDYSVDELWQRVSAVANMLLQRNGVNGNFDCHHDWRGQTHMKFHITYRPPKRSRKI